CHEMLAHGLCAMRCSHMACVP
ncbi:hypothetical protein CLOM_g8711, partial [Closterium sp. NIES-68]